MKLEWNVYIEDVNRNNITVYNIFDHPLFLKDVIEAYSKHKDNYNQFCEKVDRSLHYFFWSKCEWEIILSAWPPYEKFKEEKIDVYQQVMLNRDIFFKYIWENIR